MTKVKIKIKKTNRKPGVRQVLGMSLQVRAMGIMDMALGPKSKRLSLRKHLLLRAKKFTSQVREWFVLPRQYGTLGAIKWSASAVLIVALLLQTGAFAFTNTFAYFSSTANSQENTFSAGTLDISLTLPESSSTLNPGDSIVFPVGLQQAGSLGFNYVIKAWESSGELCEPMQLAVSLNGVLQTSLSPDNFVSATTTFASGQDWSFTASLPDSVASSYQNKTCEVRLSAIAWQENMPSPDTGFSDVAEISKTLQSGEWEVAPPTSGPLGVVLNEFLPNPVGYDDAIMPGGEWIELYNLSTSSIDLTGYYLKDVPHGQEGGHIINIAGCRTNTGGTVINGNDYLVVYVRGTGDCSNSHNFSINNGSGAIVLYKTGQSNAVDEISYQPQYLCELDPTQGDTNGSTIPESDECKGNINENKSIARIPNGTGEWIDPIPTPGQPNILSEEEQQLLDDVSGSGGTGGNEGTLEPQDVLEEDEETAAPQGSGDPLSDVIIEEDKLTPSAGEDQDPEILVEQGDEAILPDTDTQAIVPEIVEPAPPDPAGADGGEGAPNPDPDNPSTGTEPAAGGSDE